MPDNTNNLAERLWQLRRRGLSYASDKPAVNLLLADMAEGLEQAAERISADQSLSARIAVLREALESIARYDVGLQGLVEDGTDTPENVAKYYAGQVERRRKIARIANNLVERLLRKEPCFPVHLGKFDGHGQTTITQQVTTDGLRLVNPDGPDAADALQSLSARIAVLEARQHGGENGAAGDAIDYALGHITNPKAQLGFLDDWRDGRDLETRWPGYVRWLGVQRAGAAKALASITREGT